MIPAVRIPASAKLPTPVEIKLKAGWQFDAAQRAFVSARGERFTLRGALPPRSKVLHTTPDLAAAMQSGKARLTAAEKNLVRHLQVILPPSRARAKIVEAIRQWPCVENAALQPEMSLPGGLG